MKDGDQEDYRGAEHLSRLKLVARVLEAGVERENGEKDPARHGKEEGSCAEEGHVGDEQAVVVGIGSSEYPHEKPDHFDERGGKVEEDHANVVLDILCVADDLGSGEDGSEGEQAQEDKRQSLRVRHGLVGDGSACSVNQRIPLEGHTVLSFDVHVDDAHALADKTAVLSLFILGGGHVNTASHRVFACSLSLYSSNQPASQEQAADVPGRLGRPPTTRCLSHPPNLPNQEGGPHVKTPPPHEGTPHQIKISQPNRISPPPNDDGTKSQRILFLWEGRLPCNTACSARNQLLLLSRLSQVVRLVGECLRHRSKDGFRILIWGGQFNGVFAQGGCWVSCSPDILSGLWVEDLWDFGESRVFGDVNLMVSAGL